MITFLEGTLEEKNPGHAVINVGGGGPKIAVTALSGFSMREQKTALIESDVKRLSPIFGIAKKTAERDKWI
jgi:holliday junction DNA helicase RuvA